MAWAYVKLNRFAEAEETFRLSLRLNPKFPDAHYELSRLLSNQQRWDEAESWMRKGVQLTPDDANAHVLLGSFLSRRDKWQEAEAEFREALRLEPNNHRTLNDFGYALVERNERLDEALAMIERALKAEPKNPYYLDSLGWAYFKLGDLDAAERYLSEAASINPKSATVHEHIGDLQEGRGQAEQARASWQKALSCLRTPLKLRG